jgi:hypothetical protein
MFVKKAEEVSRQLLDGKIIKPGRRPVVTQVGEPDLKTVEL